MSRNNKRRRAAQGFTLIEVLLVLVILVIIGAIAATSIFGMQDQANKDAAKTQVNAIDNAIKHYRLYANSPPEKLEDLLSKPSNKAHADKWNGPYLDKKISTDPWGNEYKYSKDGKKNSDKPDVWSMGPDGDDQTDDDIGNWDK